MWAMPSAKKWIISPPPPQGAWIWAGVATRATSPTTSRAVPPRPTLPSPSTTTATKGANAPSRGAMFIGVAAIRVSKATTCSPTGVTLASRPSRDRRVAIPWRSLPRAMPPTPRPLARVPTASSTSSVGFRGRFCSWPPPTRLLRSTMGPAARPCISPKAAPAVTAAMAVVSSPHP